MIGESTTPTRAPQWEIVRTDACWHIRFRAANNEIVVAGEPLSNYSDAMDAIESVIGEPVYANGTGAWALRAADALIVVRVDERSKG